jgi:hypothetical protein
MEHDRGAHPPFVTRRAGSSHSSPALLVTLLPQLPPLLLLARPAHGASPTICVVPSMFAHSNPCAIAKSYDESLENLVAS